jgi:glycosyltransferase involved in cell wall biosynthesis
MIKLSVIVPNYNHERFLVQRLDSILNQTYHDFEIIILDDCSTDNSKDIIEQYRGNQKVKHIIYNETNSGSTFKQWKKGIELAQGEYIWIAESDDIAKLNLLAELMENTQKEQNIVIAYAKSTNDLEVFSATNNEANYPVKIYDGVSFINQYMLTNPAIVNASAVVFKKSAADNYILTEITKYKYAGDWLFWNYLLAKGKVAQHNKTLNYFRRHTDSVAARGDKSGLFIHEGFKLLLFTKKRLKIFLPVNLIKVWASIWAQNYLLNRKKSSSIVTNNIHTSLLISPLLVTFFISYYVKFRWFSNYNITY